MFQGEKALEAWFDAAFMIFMPKDIVSGDFYWIKDIEGKKVLIAADCTGHGVPGAFMTIFGKSVFDQVVVQEKITDPGDILTRANNLIKEELHAQTGIADGMDASILVIDYSKNQIAFAGAKNPLYAFSNQEFIQIKGDKYPLGSHPKMGDVRFTTHLLDLNQGDRYYIFSDGYQDQYSETSKQKFTTKRFRTNLASLFDQTLEAQKEKLLKDFTDWKQDSKQTDDIIIMGIQV
jgi:serine phosphatase RsbU (regulator of sigma subunit)